VCVLGKDPGEAARQRGAGAGQVCVGGGGPVKVKAGSDPAQVGGQSLGVAVVADGLQVLDEVVPQVAVAGGQLPPGGDLTVRPERRPGVGDRRWSRMTS
jgi:hypothetical protein